MICNFVCTISWIVFPVGMVERWNFEGFGRAMWNQRVEPVEPAWAVLVRSGWKSSGVVPPVPPTSSTKINNTASSTTGTTINPAWHDGLS